MYLNRFEIDKLCDEIDAMAAELAQLQANGQVGTCMHVHVYTCTVCLQLQ